MFHQFLQMFPSYRTLYLSRNRVLINVVVRKRILATEKEKPIEDIRFDSYADYFVLNWKKGIIRFSFGQAVYKPPRIYANIHMSPPDLEAFYKMISENLPLIRKAQET